MKGTFIISLDFELHWGGFEKWPLRGTRYEVGGTNEGGTRYELRGTNYEGRLPADKVGGTNEGGTKDELRLPADEVGGTNYKVQSTNNDGAKDYTQYFLNTREVIPEMLELFKKYEVHVTWATVGMLLHRSKEELINNMPVQKPSYTTQELSAYHFIQHMGIGNDETTDPFHFAPSLIGKIISTPGQELGTHTFAHYYCNEEGQSVEQFREDIRAAGRAASMYGKKVSSLVFPRNQFNDQYLKVCYEEGITAVRSNPLDWFWNIESTQYESSWKRLNRGLDAYFPIGKKNTFPPGVVKVREGLPVCIPASRLFRPYRPGEFFLNDLKIQRIRKEMTEAAKAGEVYHLWWHPHNFGQYPEQSLTGLERILKHYAYCRDTWSMSSMNMGEFAALIHHGK